jgi:hypothetical protein
MTTLILNSNGPASLTFEDDGKLSISKFEVSPDGSLKLGEALTIDPNGIVTLNGAEFRILNGYDLIFDAGGGPVLTSENVSKFKVVVSNEGVLSTIPA